MNRIVFAMCFVAFSSTVFAQEGMDMSTMGPWTRKAKNEAALKKEIADFLRLEDALMAKGDMEAMFARVHFPVFMATDNAQGAIEARTYSRDEYIAMMKPFFENAPKDMKTLHKPTITLLSDSLAVVVDEFTMVQGKMRFGGKNMSLLAKIDGQWKFKSMVEAGWGNTAPDASAKPNTPAVKN